MSAKNDIKVFLKDGQFDIDLENGDFINDSSFETAIWVSLYSNTRAGASQIGIPEKRSGWLGNLVNKDYELGSLLYLSDQQRLTQDTINEKVDAANKGLKWFIGKGFAKSVDVSGEIVPLFGIRLKLVFNVDTDTTTFYINTWELTVNV